MTTTRFPAAFQTAIIEFRHIVAKTMAVAGGQIVNGFYNAIRSRAGPSQITGFINALWR
jgi:hypothetical protein